MELCLQHFVFLFLTTIVVVIAQIPSECERGVKRAHPTQENAFQILSRKGWRHQWLDGECRPPLIYNQAVCDCVEALTPSLPPSSVFPQFQDAWSQPQEQWSNSPRPDPQEQQPQQQNQRPQRQQQQQQQQQSTEPRYETSYPSTPPRPTSVQEACRFHRPNSDPTKYDRLSDRGWSTEDCNWPIYLGLVWDQERCRCDWGTDIPVIRSSGPSTTVTNPCIVMLNMTFDQFVVDESSSHWLNRKNEYGVRILPEPGSRGQCALFRDSSVSVPFFKSNTLGSLFRITFSFRECTGEDPDQEIVLLHNGCSDIRTPPTIALGYRPRSRIFMMEFGTTNDIATTREECQVNSERENRWIDVDIRYDGGYLDVLINGEVCIGTSQFSGDVKTTDCAMTLPGENMCVYMDELLITRGCTA